MDVSHGTPPKFYDLSLEQRWQWLREHTDLTPEDIAALSGQAGLSAEQANHMIENVIGTFALPLGIARHFVINGREVLVPMAIEEPSVVAGASFAARLARAGGGFTAHATAPEMIGQMQILNLADPPSARLRLLEAREELLAAAAAVDPVLQRLGGGPRDLEVRLIESSPLGPFLVLHLIYDVRDAMGANAVNTAVERLAGRVQAITGGKVLLRILSNLADRRLARARCTIPLRELAFGDFRPEEVRDGIIAAWAFAAADPYRAATHNKGILNGVDAVVIATGNDWRAVEAGAHAYAARNGRYTSLSTWGKDEQGNLVGTLEMPLAVGIVGGATRVHPAARAALKLMGVTTARELAEIIVSVGLAQNLAALRALATEGIQRGHMALHARQVAIAAGATGEEIERLAEQLVRENTVRIDRAEEILREWREKQT
ncbi:hydroxymethylglutaryl-CoA reductase, degradative [Thermanaerothrix sp. 4228-RoL]|uniref:3-hydroxy-3-methylglutaryl coenzyme A reductase n=1 Tax=Thermanaerothrix solaris TaxID=3058434 RepID=A0ABU3NNT8_9CHLR|nr:hydroxymethylglutaryl-CoA reductase, degradative [Thermanaerothrix sp. 4228-RoL]MDT8898505.1 hydroxymethylglutaryl-CoA reductase, degradative [Thermanaerothrix sp. 4228-RoL]